jgi:excisionase family DNA binding protein
MSLLAVSEAAERLGVSTRQVHHLVARGELRQVARGVLDETSVERLAAVRGGSHRRAWSEATAWGAVALLSGAEANWMGESQRSRLKGRLRRLSAVELVERARERAEVTRYAAHSSAGQYLLGELVYATDVASRLGLAATNNIDGYLAAPDVDGVVSRHGLIPDDAGRVMLRATSIDLDVVRDMSKRGVVLAALDLAESLDVRERRAGLDALEAALGAFRG